MRAHLVCVVVKRGAALKSVLRGNFFEISRIANVICTADMLEKYDKYGLVVYFEFRSLLTTRGGEKGGIIRSIRSIRAKFKFFFREAGKTRLLGAGD